MSLLTKILEKHHIDREKVIWYALAAYKDGAIDQVTYSGIISDEINPYRALPAEYLKYD